MVRSITESLEERTQVLRRVDELDFRFAGFGGLRLSWRSPPVGNGVLRSGTQEAGYRGKVWELKV